MQSSGDFGEETSAKGAFTEFLDSNHQILRERPVRCGVFAGQVYLIEEITCWT